MIESSLTRLPDLIVEDPISICLTFFHFISKMETLFINTKLIVKSNLGAEKKWKRGRCTRRGVHCKKKFFSSQPGSSDLPVLVEGGGCDQLYAN